MTIKRYEAFQDWSAILEDYPMVGMKEDPEGDLVYNKDHAEAIASKDRNIVRLKRLLQFAYNL